MKLRALFFVLCLPAVIGNAAEQLGPNLVVERGAINRVVLTRDGARLAIYGGPVENDPPVEVLLLTHHRRDVIKLNRFWMITSLQINLLKSNLVY